MRTIFFLRQGIYDPTEAYYRRFEEAISTAEMEKCTAKTHTKLNITYTVGDNDNGTRILKAMFPLIWD